MALAVMNFHVLTGASTRISIALVSLVPFAAVVGWLAARRLRSVAPTRFAGLGQDRT
jgi:hypothetical protein